MTGSSCFGDLRVATVHAEDASISWDAGHSNAKLVLGRSGSHYVLQLQQASGIPIMQCVLTIRTAWRAGVALFFVSPLSGGTGGTLYAVQCGGGKAAADQLQAALDAAAAAGGSPAPAPAFGADPAAGTAHVANGDGDAARGATGAACHSGRAIGSGVQGASNGSAVASPLRLPQPSPGRGPDAAAADGAGPGPPPGGPPHSPYHPTLTADQDRLNGGGGGGGCALPAQSGAADGDTSAANEFDRKICRASSEMYFHYYGMLQHQQNMLQDYTRTGTYYQAIVGNPDDFRGRTVLDVGAGSGILSLFAAQAGAARVYAVEASGMARFARLLADSNPALGSRITVINSKVEELSLPERVDVLVSEPMGTLLVNERMLESYLYARDRFLKPGGKMFPQLGRIHAAAFSDEALYSEVAAKSAFWLQPSFYGVDVTALHTAATEGYFGQVVVDAFDPAHLVSDCASRVLDFGTLPESELLDIDMPLSLTTGAMAPVTVHGLACWFDVFFAGGQLPVWLTTAPGMATTHWFQLRCVLAAPLLLTQPHTRLTGRLHLVAHERQSYDIHLTLTAPPLTPGGPPQTSSGKFDLKEPYYRSLGVVA